MCIIPARRRIYIKLSGLVNQMALYGVPRATAINAIRIPIEHNRMSRVKKKEVIIITNNFFMYIFIDYIKLSLRNEYNIIYIQFIILDIVSMSIITPVTVVPIQNITVNLKN